MAINNTNTVSTKVGLDLTSCYIRIYGRLKIDGSYEVFFNVYKDKASYTANNQDLINSQLDFDFSEFITAPLTSNQGYDYLHDLVIAKLVERGLDIAKLEKVDLV